MTDSTSPLMVSISVANKAVYSTKLTDALEFGRQRTDEAAAYARVPGKDCDRIIIADLEEVKVSRQHLKITRLEGCRLQLQNRSDKNLVALPGGRILQPGDSTVLDAPLVCQVGGKTIRVQSEPREDLAFQSLPHRTVRPGASLAESSQEFAHTLRSMRTHAEARLTEESLCRLLKYTVQVFQSAASSADFLQTAAQAALEMVELDEVVVLLREKEDWSVRASRTGDGEPLPVDWRPSSTMLQQISDQRQTMYYVPQREQSLIGIQSFVAAPILDVQGEVIGALYGQRRKVTATGQLPSLTQLEAALFEVLASGIASGLARVEKERQIIAERVRFEQFFTPELARELESQGAELLAARDAEVTVMFCDIKGFSRISRVSGAQLAIEWVRDVLSVLSDCVAEHQGVLVDYVGDSIEALWGAPRATPEHARLACRAALQMRRRLPELNARWESRLNDLTDVSIGINSGRAQVGNIGSRRKFKYGAFGTTVNQASRVQGVTKLIGISLLITRSTTDLLGPEFLCRRLATVRTVNIDEPVELFELTADADAAWRELKQKYEEALALYQAGQFQDAIRILGPLVGAFPLDQPSMWLMHRCSEALRKPPGTFSTEWVLDSK